MPLIAVTSELGNDIKSFGRTIEIDHDALNNVLLDQGVPEERLGDVTFTVDSPYKLGRRGQASTDIEYGEYRIFIFPSMLQRLGFRSKRMQKTVVHEARHIGDYMANGFMEDEAKHDRFFRLRNLRRRIGTAACTLASIAFLPETVEHGSKPLIQEAVEKDSDLMAVSGVMLPPSSVILAYSLSKHAIYRAQKFERRARKAARQASNYPQVISINR